MKELRVHWADEVHAAVREFARERKINMSEAVLDFACLALGIDDRGRSTGVDASTTAPSGQQIPPEPMPGLYAWHRYVAADVGAPVQEPPMTLVDMMQWAKATGNAVAADKLQWHRLQVAERKDVNRAPDVPKTAEVMATVAVVPESPTPSLQVLGIEATSIPQPLSPDSSVSAFPGGSPLPMLPPSPTLQTRVMLEPAVDPDTLPPLLINLDDEWPES